MSICGTQAANVDQADGAPQWFGAAGQAGRFFRPASTAQTTILNDWRQVTVPAGAEPGEDWRLVVGVYNPQTR